MMRSVRIWFTKKDSAKYISHLDLTRCLIRAFRRTDIPLWYTEGFNPHPHLVFGLPLPLGVEGLRETLDIRLNDESYKNEDVIKSLNNVSVPGIEFLEIAEPVEKTLSITNAIYNVIVPNIENTVDFIDRINSVISSGSVIIQKKTKKKEIKEINVCEHLKDFSISSENNIVKMSFNLPAGNDFTVNPVSFCDVLFKEIGKENILHRIVRLK
ncbi:MAG: TIGR03936 family radical SAM-associated protein, partial [Oscillospiraceae bacterium]|nr:TIGR03936 family radical SAM-associated protein [Oscillospiraceae bacterium]